MVLASFDPLATQIPNAPASVTGSSQFFHHHSVSLLGSSSAAGVYCCLVRYFRSVEVQLPFPSWQVQQHHLYAFTTSTSIIFQSLMYCLCHQKSTISAGLLPGKDPIIFTADIVIETKSTKYDTSFSLIGKFDICLFYTFSIGPKFCRSFPRLDGL